MKIELCSMFVLCSWIVIENYAQNHELRAHFRRLILLVFHLGQTAAVITRVFVWDLVLFLQLSVKLQTGCVRGLLTLNA